MYCSPGSFRTLHPELLSFRLHCCG
jgi:hypothetical protein